jgi:hypothetical protein
MIHNQLHNINCSSVMHKANQFSLFSSQFYRKRICLMCCMRCSIIMSGLCSPTQDTLAMEVRSEAPFLLVLFSFSFLSCSSSFSKSFLVVEFSLYLPVCPDYSTPLRPHTRRITALASKRGTSEIIRLSRHQPVVSLGLPSVQKRMHTRIVNSKHKFKHSTAQHSTAQHSMRNRNLCISCPKWPRGITLPSS